MIGEVCSSFPIINPFSRPSEDKENLRQCRIVGVGVLFQWGEEGS